MKAIRQPPAVGYDGVQALASRALAVNEAAIDLISNREGKPTPDLQVYVAMQLFRASFDHGRGMLYLLAANPQDMAGPALALHRSQTENFLRGAYLGFMAKPEVVDDFLENDEGVREPKDDGGALQVIGPLRLAKRVEALITELSSPDVGDPSLETMVKNAWKPLCGMVHGGKAVHALYQDHQGEIGCAIPAPHLVPFIANSMALSNFALLLSLSKIYGENEIDPSSSFTKAFLAFLEMHQDVTPRKT
ncbi:DUF6988 family protein [Thermomonas fusca]